MPNNWTEQEEELLRQLRENGTPPTEIARRLNRSTSAICQHAIRAMGLAPLRAPKRYWADGETDTLHAMFPTTRIGEIAEKLRRSEQSTRDKAKNEGLLRRDFPI
tara:strand:+ start:14859 stop:15173 length:315 start_codon:yes stop_codon:yes gene_type:complete